MGKIILGARFFRDCCFGSWIKITAYLKFLCRDLQKLSCNNNALRELPPGMLEMPNLSYVNACSNSLERLVMRGNVAQSLKNLNLSNNLLTSLPEQFRDSSIQTLKLSRNQFTSFPGAHFTYLYFEKQLINHARYSSFFPSF